ncbi:MAG: phage tail protein [Flavobacterium sp.]|nr:phage tail protein [Flavobacterium sp.]
MKKSIFLTLLVSFLIGTSNIVAQGDQYIGQIKAVAFPFAPRGWAQCNGQLLPINQNQALFSLLGTQYGGNGTTNFALPDLRGRAIVHSGQGNGTLNVAQGEQAGTENTSLLISNMPAHYHTIVASSLAGDTSVPTNSFPANSGALDKEYASQSNSTMAASGSTGGNQPVNNMKPYSAVYYVIALQGIFPSRN